MFSIRLSVVVLGLVTIPAFCLAQEKSTTIDKSPIPGEANDISKFVPKGWKIEEQLKGDLNGDTTPDYVLELIEDKLAKDKDDNPIDRARALVIVLQSGSGKLSRAAVADKLLQCTQCGGAFYGMTDATAEVKIDKRVIIVSQDHGSRWLTETTYRFRYDAFTQAFALIGFDFSNRDRAAGAVASESTNYLTGVRQSQRGNNNRTASTTAHFRPEKISIEEVGYETFEEDASKRLHLN
jgi:hypothetical protein